MAWYHWEPMRCRTWDPSLLPQREFREWEVWEEPIPTMGDILADASTFAYMNIVPPGSSLDNPDVFLAGDRSYELISPPGAKGDCHLHRHIQSLVGVLKRDLLLSDHDHARWDLRCTAAAAAASLARTVVFPPDPFYPGHEDFEAFRSLVKPLWSSMVENGGALMDSFVTTTSYMTAHMEKDLGLYYGDAAFGLVLRAVLSELREEDAVSSVLMVFRKHLDNITDGNDCWLVPTFIKIFWDGDGAVKKLNRELYKQLLDVTVLAANRVGFSTISKIIAEKLHGQSELYIAKVTEIIRKAVGTDEYAPPTEEAKEEELLLEMDRLFAPSSSS